MLYQLSYASPDSRVSRLKNKAHEAAKKRDHSCQGYHTVEGLRN